MPNKGAGLEQVGTSGAGSVDAEIGAAAGERKAGNRKRREPIVGADRGAVDAAGRAVRSQRRIAVGGLRSAEARRPDAPVLSTADRRRQRRLGDTCGKGIALPARMLGAARRIGVGSWLSSAKAIAPGAAGVIAARRRRMDRATNSINCVMAPKVVCCEPVPSSPDNCDSAPGSAAGGRFSKPENPGGSEPLALTARSMADADGGLVGVDVRRPVRAPATASATRCSSRSSAHR